ncbi:MAG TPA: CsbD family protein [Candidatus Acidoferrales bacterium]|nr:CsbD family protein [Candidatus Acidoferrales bacterium]
MNWDQLQGKWKQSKGKFREKWGKLTDDDLDVIAGNRDQLVGRIQERYGIAKEAAQEQADAFVEAMRDEDAAHMAAAERMRNEKRVSH